MKKNNKTAQETKIVSLRLCLHILKKNGSLRLLNIIISSNKFIIYNVFELRNKPKESISKHAFNLNIYISAFESGVLRPALAQCATFQFWLHPSAISGSCSDL